MSDKVEPKTQVPKLKEVEKIDKKAEEKKNEIKLYSGNEQFLTIAAGTDKAQCTFRIPFGVDFNFAYDCCMNIMSAIKKSNDLAVKKALEDKKAAEDKNESKEEDAKA